MGLRVAALPTRNIENTVLIFNEEQLIQFEDYERLQNPEGLVCFQKKLNIFTQYLNFKILLDQQCHCKEEKKF